MLNQNPPPGGGANKMAVPQPQQQPGHVHDLHGQPAPMSYSGKLMANVQKSERFKRNVLEINLEYDDTHQHVDKSMVADTFAMLGIDLKSQLDGYQITSKKIFAWCKEAVSLDRFCREEVFRVTGGVKTGLIKPMEKKNVAVTIRGLNLNTPDSMVMEYISKFGEVVNKKVVYDTDKEGPFAGLKNGDRKYLIDFTNGRNMGTFHLIDGMNVTVRYAGQRRTCGRCHETSVNCPGDGWAKACEEKNGPRVTLREHMTNLWSAIGFKPSEFKLQYDEGGELLEKVVEIKESGQFTPPHKSKPKECQDKDKFVGVTIKNLPKDIPEREVTLFLEGQGLDIAHPGVNIIKNFKSTKVDITDLDAKLCNTMIENIHERVFFTRKVYCRGVLEVTKLGSNNADQPTHDAEADPGPANPAPATEKAQANPGPANPGQATEKADAIPGPVTEKAEATPGPAMNSSPKAKEKPKQKSKANSKTKTPPKPIIPGLAVESPPNKKTKKSKKHKLGKSDFLIKTRDGEVHEGDFVFDDVSEDSGDDDGKGFFKTGPKDVEDHLLTQSQFKSRSAKTIQKEELWNLSLQKAGNTLKRSLELSPEEHRRTKSRSICLG